MMRSFLCFSGSLSWQSQHKFSFMVRWSEFEEMNPMILHVKALCISD